jgi:hypothetical protein
LPLAAQEPRLLAPDEVMQLPSGTVEHRSSYGRDSAQFGELRLPPGRGPFPVAVVVHGGCFDARATLRSTAALADALRREGFATWNVEYRSIEHPGGAWPGTFTDVGAALDHVRELARQFPLDTAQVVAMGQTSAPRRAVGERTRRKGCLRGGVPFVRRRPLVARSPSGRNLAQPRTSTPCASETNDLHSARLPAGRLRKQPVDAVGGGVALPPG